MVHFPDVPRDPLIVACTRCGPAPFHGARKYVNNIVEQDHRRVKFRVSAMLGFKSFRNARAVLAGIELI